MLQKIQHTHKQLWTTAPCPSTADGAQPSHKDNTSLPCIPQAVLSGGEAQKWFDSQVLNPADAVHPFWRIAPVDACLPVQLSSHCCFSLCSQINSRAWVCSAPLHLPLCCIDVSCPCNHEFQSTPLLAGFPRRAKHPHSSGVTGLSRIYLLKYFALQIHG